MFKTKNYYKIVICVLFTFIINSIFADSSKPIKAYHLTASENAQQMQNGISFRALEDDRVKNKAYDIEKILNAIDNAKLTHIESIKSDKNNVFVSIQLSNVDIKYVYNEKSDTLDKVSSEPDLDISTPPGSTVSLRQAIRLILDKRMVVNKVLFKGNAWKINALDNDGIDNEFIIDASGSKILRSSQEN